jgi:hypothetical protein
VIITTTSGRNKKVSKLRHNKKKTKLLRKEIKEGKKKGRENNGGKRNYIRVKVNLLSEPNFLLLLQQLL